MVQPVTRQEHYHALRDKANPMEYCRNLFYDKTRSNIPLQDYEVKLILWLKLKGNFSVIVGCTMVKNFYSKKFA